MGLGMHDLDWPDRILSLCFSLADLTDLDFSYKTWIRRSSLVYRLRFKYTRDLRMNMQSEKPALSLSTFM